MSTESMTRHWIVAPDGVRLAVSERPGSGPTFLFLHGLLQAGMAWQAVCDEAALQDCRLIVPDLRGHGASDKPDLDKAYRDGRSWAGDIHAIIRSLGLERPFVVAWSYGGRMLGDYLDAYGSEALGGCIFVAATTKTDPGHLAGDLGMLFRQVVSDDFETQTRALCAFAARVSPPPLDSSREEAVACAASVPVAVRRHLMGRPADYSQALISLTCPALVIQGGEDRIVMPPQSAWTAEVTKGKYELWEEAGHAPFLEQPTRFARVLRAFAGQ